MSTHRVVSVINKKPTFEIPLAKILSELSEGGALKILTPLEYHTEQQRKWYKGVCLTGLSEWNGETKDEWDARLKQLCGGGLLNVQEIYMGEGHAFQRLTIVGVGKKKMTEFIENILSVAITEDWPVTPPDKELRSPR